MNYTTGTSLVLVLQAYASFAVGQVAETAQVHSSDADSSHLHPQRVELVCSLLYTALAARIQDEDRYCFPLEEVSVCGQQQWFVQGRKILEGC
jgi:hypothetical protein